MSLTILTRLLRNIFPSFLLHIQLSLLPSHQLVYMAVRKLLHLCPSLASPWVVPQLWFMFFISASTVHTYYICNIKKKLAICLNWRKNQKEIILSNWFKHVFIREKGVTNQYGNTLTLSIRQVQLIGDTPPTWFLPEGVVDVNVHGSVCDIQQHTVVLPAELVGTFDAHVIPVWPVHPVFEDGDGEWVRYLLHDRVSTGAIQLAISGRETGGLRSELGNSSKGASFQTGTFTESVYSLPRCSEMLLWMHQDSTKFLFLFRQLQQNILRDSFRHVKKKSPFFLNKDMHAWVDRHTRWMGRLTNRPTTDRWCRWADRQANTQTRRQRVWKVVALNSSVARERIPSAEEAHFIVP